MISQRNHAASCFKLSWLDFDHFKEEKGKVIFTFLLNKWKNFRNLLKDIASSGYQQLSAIMCGTSFLKMKSQFQGPESKSCSKSAAKKCWGKINDTMIDKLLELPLGATVIYFFASNRQNCTFTTNYEDAT